MRKLKVFCGNTFVGGNQIRVLVAATSQKRAAEIARVPLGYVRDYWSITANKEDVEAAMEKPEKLVIAPR